MYESVKELIESGGAKEYETDPAGVKKIIATAKFIGLAVAHVKPVSRSKRLQGAFIIYNGGGLDGTRLTIYGVKYEFIIIRHDGPKIFTSGTDHLKVSL